MYCVSNGEKKSLKIMYTCQWLNKSAFRAIECRSGIKVNRLDDATIISKYPIPYY